MKTAYSSNWLQNFNFHFENIRKFAFNVSVFLGTLLLLGLAWKEYHKNNFILEEFHVPQNFEQNGYTGLVIASQLFDKVDEMKNKVSSLKEDNANFSSSAHIPDMNIEVVGMGISIQSTVEYFKALLGNPSRHLSGEITQQDSLLTLNLRITGESTLSFATHLKNKTVKEALDTLYTQAGGEILRNSEPYLLAAYLHAIKRTDEALLMLDYVSQTAPKEDDHWAYALWGGILSTNAYKDSLEAIKKFEKALSLEKRMPSVYYNWAILHSSAKNYEKALEFYQKSVSIEPNYTRGYLGMALTYRRLKEYEEAHQIFEKLEKKRLLNAEAYVAWGNLFNDEKKYEEAIQKYQYASFLDPKRVLTYNQIALCYYSAKRYEEGLAYIQKGIALEPQTGVLYSTLAELQEGMGDTEAFYKSVEKGFQNNWIPTSLSGEPYKKYHQDARFLEIIGNYPKVKKLFEKEQKNP